MLLFHAVKFKFIGIIGALVGVVGVLLWIYNAIYSAGELSAESRNVAAVHEAIIVQRDRANEALQVQLELEQSYHSAAARRQQEIERLREKLRANTGQGGDCSVHCRLPEL